VVFSEFRRKWDISFEQKMEVSLLFALKNQKFVDSSFFSNLGALERILSPLDFGPPLRKMDFLK